MKKLADILKTSKFSILLVAVIALVGIPFLPSTEPVYQSKSFSVWFEESLRLVQLSHWRSPYSAFNIEPTNRSQFLEPFKAMGQPAVEQLSHYIGRRETKFIKLYRLLHSKVPKSVSQHLPLPLDAKIVREHSAAILIMMGNQSRTAIPRLVRWLRSHDPSVRATAAQVLLALVGSEDVNLVPQFTDLLNDRDGHVSWLILQACFKIDSEPIQTIPALLKELNSPDEIHRLYAAERLSRFIPEEANRIQPALEKARDDPNSTVRRAVEFALQSMIVSDGLE